MNARTTRSRRRRTVAISVIAATLTVAGVGGGVALAAPESAAGQVLGAALDELGVDWSGMPDNYTKEQYLAFWGAGYTPEDAEALQALWGTDWTETKARAGQMILDGETVPVPPSGTTAGDPGDDTERTSDPGDGTEEPGSETGDGDVALYTAAIDAGYTPEDIDALAALWQTEWMETKARVGQAVIDGQTLPVAPGSSVAGS
ncbi:hypothetical protein [Cellulomonas sp. S1-8]|uniref:hypothetical protein n=1 Tax=Cellulomonas sp. S1-8 TaxID=2904790 RepID=UPI0022445899|nr:hypothetical protein [Cellulomonas sp. S1-8]UZN02841.1 hypothetical protein OKX07_17580 [Cellulomonas sp. S1-8]